MLPNDFANRIILIILSDLMKLKKRDGKDNTMDDAGQYFQVNVSMQKNFPEKTSESNPLARKNDFLSMSMIIF